MPREYKFGKTATLVFDLICANPGITSAQINDHIPHVDRRDVFKTVATLSQGGHIYKSDNKIPAKWHQTVKEEKPAKPPRIVSCETNTGISDFLGWAPNRPGSMDAFNLPSREGERLIDRVVPKSMCVGARVVLTYAPSRMQQ